MAAYGVIFDMDGVLIDSYHAHYESWRRMVQRHGLAMTEQQFAETFGQTNRAIINHLYPDATPAELATMADEKELAFREVIRESLPAMPGVGELLIALHAAGLRMAVGSSGPRENVEAVLAALPGGELMDARVTGCDVTHGKPHPEVFLKAAEKLGLPPHRCCVIEDAPAGLEAAHRAGMVAVGITGTAPRERLAERAARVVDALSELGPEDIAELIDQHAASKPPL